jgi:hypothetical protein
MLHNKKRVDIKVLCLQCKGATPSLPSQRSTNQNQYCLVALNFKGNLNTVKSSCNTGVRTNTAVTTEADHKVMSILITRNEGEDPLNPAMSVAHSEIHK